MVAKSLMLSLTSAQGTQSAQGEEIKQGKVPEAWQSNPDRLRQKELDARWVKKNGVSHYGHKNSISTRPMA